MKYVLSYCNKYSICRVIVRCCYGDSVVKPDLSMRIASVRLSFSSQVSFNSAMIFSVSYGTHTHTQTLNKNHNQALHPEISNNTEYFYLILTLKGEL